MTTRAEWAEPCPDCGAIDACCATAKARLETANSLARLVDRQVDAIRSLRAAQEPGLEAAQETLKEAVWYLEKAAKFFRYQKAGKEFEPNREGLEATALRVKALLAASGQAPEAAPKPKEPFFCCGDESNPCHPIGDYCSRGRPAAAPECDDCDGAPDGGHTNAPPCKYA